jgi:hypothetical protein
MTSQLSPTDARAYRAELRAQDRYWCHGFEAGIREHRRLAIVGIVVALVVLFRRHLHPVIALAWAVAIVLACAPFLVLGLAVSVTVRTHRHGRSWRRTLAMAGTWLAGLGLIAAVALLAWPPAVLVFIPAGAVAWIVDGHRRLRQALRYTLPPPPIEPFPHYDEPEPYRVLSTSWQRHSEVRRFSDGTVTTIDPRSGQTVDGTDE